MSEKKTEKKDEREAALVPQEQAEKIVLTADFGAVYVKRSESGQLLRPVKARMIRMACMVASVPELQSRARSAQGMQSMSCSA